MYHEVLLKHFLKPQIIIFLFFICTYLFIICLEKKGDISVFVRECAIGPPTKKVDIECKTESTDDSVRIEKAASCRSLHLEKKIVKST